MRKFIKIAGIVAAVLSAAAAAGYFVTRLSSVKLLAQMRHDEIDGD